MAYCGCGSEMLKTKRRIAIQEVKFCEWTYDNVGKIFFWKGHVFRAIHKEYSEHVKELLASEMVKELMGEGFFIDSWITDYEIDGYDLVIEHRKIDRVTYCREWTFSMLKDTALLVLRIAMIAADHGYYLKDCHPGNILFDGSRPIYIDIGSFIRGEVETKENRDCFRCYPEFLQLYYYPLKVYSLGDEQGANTLAVRLHKSYLLWKWGLLRRVNPAALRKLISLYFSAMVLPFCENEEIRRAHSRLNGKLLMFMRKRAWLFRHTTSRSLSRKIEQITFGPTGSARSCHHNIHGARGEVSSSPYLDEILRLIESENISSVVQFGGPNVQFLERLLIQTSVKQVVCIDNDPSAIEKAYTFAKNRSFPITPAVVDLADPEPAERLKAQAVAAVPLERYLQQYPLESILKSLASYTNDYAFVEFMISKPCNRLDASVPQSEWCDRWSLRKAFEKHFNCVAELRFEPDRILFVGRLQGNQ